MRRRPLIEPFLIEVNSPAQWTQSYDVSRDERTGVWTLYERRVDYETGAGETSAEQHETGGDVVDAIEGGLDEYSGQAPGFLDQIEIPRPLDADPPVLKALVWALLDRLFGFEMGEDAVDARAAGWVADGEFLTKELNGHAFRLVRSRRRDRAWALYVRREQAWDEIGDLFRVAKDALQAAGIYSRAVAIPGRRGPIDANLRSTLGLRSPSSEYQSSAWTSSLARARLQVSFACGTRVLLRESAATRAATPAIWSGR